MGILDDLLGSYYDDAAVSTQQQSMGNYAQAPSQYGYGGNTSTQSLGNDVSKSVNQQQLGGGMQGIMGSQGQAAVTPQFQSQQNNESAGGSGLVGGVVELLRGSKAKTYETQPMQAQTDNGAILGLMNMQQQQRQYNPYQDNRFRSLMSFGRM